MMKKKFDSIDKAIKKIRNGEVIIVVDDESRENEGDFICASQKITPEIINFMSKYGRGLICCSLEEDRCDSLGLDLMVGKNTDSFNTSFTVSVCVFVVPLSVLPSPIETASVNVIVSVAIFYYYKNLY